ncbi:MAG: hypothetical protein JO119_15950 [Acidobacteria bacterium]|nr:hypothetical protein [Acidobacteriota bacterium]
MKNLLVEAQTGGAARVAVACLQGLADESEVDVPINQPKQVILWNMIFNSEVVKQRLRTCGLAHHDEQRASSEFSRERHQGD